MNRAENQELGYFPKELDTAVNERFPGANCESRLDFFGSGGYVTTWNEELPEEQKREVKAFVDGYIAGNLELRKRLSDLQNKKKPHTQIPGRLVAN